jgi:hypothetical protein
MFCKQLFAFLPKPSESRIGMMQLWKVHSDTEKIVDFITGRDFDLWLELTDTHVSSFLIGDVFWKVAGVEIEVIVLVQSCSVGFARTSRQYFVKFLAPVM